MKKSILGLLAIVLVSGSAHAETFERGCVVLELDDQSEPSSAVFRLSNDFRRCGVFKHLPIEFKIFERVGGGTGGIVSSGTFTGGGAGMSHVQADVPASRTIEILSRFNKANDVVVYPINVSGDRAEKGLVFRSKITAASILSAAACGQTECYYSEAYRSYQRREYRMRRVCHGGGHDGPRECTTRCEGFSYIVDNCS